MYNSLEVIRLHKTGNPPPKRKRRPERRPAKRRSLARNIAWSLGIAALFSGVSLAGILYALSTLRFDPQALLQGTTNPTVVYDRFGDVAFTIEPTGTRRVSLQQIPRDLQQALIATEDVRFYQNDGFDPRSAIRSLLSDLTHNDRSQGASTITEQLAKVVYLHDDKSLRYKLEEILLAIQIDRYFTKNQILDMYFNTVNFNGDTPGVENASEIYFQKDVHQLDLAQCALLAGLPQAPTAYDPFMHPVAALARRNDVLSQMEKYGYLTQAQADAAMAQPLQLASSPGILADGVPAEYASYRDYLYEEADSVGIGARTLQAGGLKVYTDLDPQLQRAAFDQFSSNRYFPPAMDGNEAQGAAVFIDPKNGGVEALIGSRPDLYQSGGFDYATETQRSPGSSIKPLVVYGPAIDSGQYNADSLLYDGPLSIGGYHPEDWEVHPTINDQVTMRNALAESWNIPAVWLLHEIGIATGIDFAERAGLSFSQADFDHLDVALGDLHPGTNPLQMADAYTAFDNAGQRLEAHGLERVVDATGNVLYQAQTIPMTVMKPATADDIVGLLRNNVVNGIAQLAGVPGEEIAGKTGSVAYVPPGWTSSPGDSDLWFCGFSPAVVGAIWEGFPDTTLRSYVPNWVGGSALPAEMFSAIMRQGTAGTATSSFSAAVNRSLTPASVPPIMGLTAFYNPASGGIHLFWKPLTTPDVYYLVFRGLASEKQLYYNRALTRVILPQDQDALSVPGHYGYQVVAFSAQTHALVGESNVVAVWVPQQFQSR